MANDPNRDLLPVKEDCTRTRHGPIERIDHQSLSKLSRCDLEDKVHKLLDEQTYLKKLSNSQEEKIKRLGTKLLRLINDKRLGGKNADQPKLPEDLHLQYVELEHENYALKDKITVLRQQLASHSRHSTIRSPARSNHTSPLMSLRQSAPHFQNEIAFQSTKKTATADLQLQEAEAHIKLLNNEIKSLHSKIEYLQQDLEKNSLDNRKTKVTENIEFIRLQRSLKQQAIQITALQAQIKNSENNQKILKEELLKAHNENDEALHIIALKQNEILNLCSKLEEKNLNRLEEDDLKQRINDLMLERDSLKERADQLMKTIESKPEETENVKALKTLLAQEKCKNKKLEDILEVKSVYCTNRSCSVKDSKAFKTSSGIVDHSVPLNEKKEEYLITDSNSIYESLLRKITYDALEKKDGWTSPVYSPTECKSVQTETINSGLINTIDSEITGDTTERESADKIKMELEVQHLREMLRSQTSRCEAQQAEINRLTLELKLNEDKCRSTLQKLDMRLSAFENLEKQSRKQQSGSSKKKSPYITPASPFRPNSALRFSPAVEENIREGENISKRAINNKSFETEKLHKQSSPSNEDSVLEHSLGSNSFRSVALGNENSINNSENPEAKRRFVDQVFLESSDEDQPKSLKTASSQRFSENGDLELNPPPKRQISDVKEMRILKTSNMSVTQSMKRSFSSISSELKLTSDLNYQDRKDQSIKVRNKIEGSQKLLISIIWLDIDSNSSLWQNNSVKLLFIDFTFLDLRGEGTETPESLPKPTATGQKCEFNFVKEVEINENRRRILQSLMNKPDLDLIIFKVVSDSEDFDQLSDSECEDVGVAVVTVKQFIEKYNKGLFYIPVKNTEDTKEVVGTLAIGIDITPGLFNPRSFKRKTSRFPHRLKYPVSRYMFSGSNVPLSLAPFTYEISQYEAPKFLALRTKPYKFKKYFTQKKNVNKRLRRHFLNDCKFSAYSTSKPSQCFEIQQFPRSSFRHFRNLIDLQKVRNSKPYSLKRKKHQCLPHDYFPFNYKHSRFEPRKLIKRLKQKHKRFLNFKKQCVSDMAVETKSNASKTNATNISGSDENEINIESDNCVGEKLEDFSAYPKSNLHAMPSKDSTSVTFTSHKLEYPDDLKRFDLSYLESDNSIPSSRKKEEVSEINNEPKASFEENIAEGLSKLKHMVNDVENAFKEHKKKTFLHPEKDYKTAKKSLVDKVPNNTTLQDLQLKEKIDKLAIPILTQISEDLSKKNKTMEPANETSSAGESKATNETDKKYSDNYKERCNPDGTWLSSTMKMDLTFTVQPNMMIKVKVKPNKESLINGKWSLQGLSLSKRGGPFIFAGLYPQERKVVSFLGQCKISKEEDFIFGIWTLFRFSRKYTDLWKSVETKLDVLTKKNSNSEKKKKKKKGKQKKQAKKTKKMKK